MSCVRFRFKSSLEYEKLSFSGLQLSVAELREKIMTEKKLGTASDFTLELMDPLNGKVYKDDNEMISRNASVVVRRVPKLTGNHRLPKTNNRDPTIPNAQQDVTSHSSTMTDAELRKTANLSSANASEEDKVLAMMSQAGADFNPAFYAKHKPRGGGGGGVGVSMLPGLMRPPPANYICHRCGQKGHWIKYCPTNGDPNFDNRRVPMKRSVGIPTNQTALASSNMPGAMLDRHGNIVIRTVDLNAVKDKSKSGPSGGLLKEENIPPELICSICNELVKEAVIIPCCGESFCDECIRDYLLENEFMCFSCKQMDVSPDTLVPNKKQRAAAKSYLNKMAELKSISVARGLPSAAIAMSALSEPKEAPVAIKKTTFSSSYSSVTSVPTTSSSSSSSNQAPVKDEASPSVVATDDAGSSKEEALSNDEAGAINEPLITAPVTLSDEPSKTTSSGSPKRNIPTEPIFSSHRSTTSSRSQSTATSTFSSRPHSSIPRHYQPPSLPLPLPLGLVHNPPLLHPLQAQLPLGQGALSTGPLSLLPPHIPALPMHVPPPLANPQLQDVASMARLTELLAAAERGSLHDGRATGGVEPPPLSLEEFYHQQSMMRRRKSYSRTPSFSRSVTPESRRSSRSYSFSQSWSRSPSRSRSRSPTRHSQSHSQTHHSHREDRVREARSPRSNGHTHSERSQHKRKRSRDSDHKEHSKRPRNHHHHHSHEEKAPESDGVKTSSGDLTSEVDQKTSSSHRHKSKRKHRKEKEHRHSERTDNSEQHSSEAKIPEPHENGVEESSVDETAIEKIVEEKVVEEEILIEQDMTEKISIASPKAPVLANNHHHSKHDKKSDRKSEKKQSRKRDRAVMSSVVGMVAKTSSDEAKVSSSSSSSLSHKKHRHHHHHTHKEKRKHKQKHRSSSSHKK